MDIHEARRKLKDLRNREKELLASAGYVHAAVISMTRMVKAAEKFNISGVQSAGLDALIKETASLLLGIASSPPKAPQVVRRVQDPVPPVVPAPTKEAKAPATTPTPVSEPSDQPKKHRYGCWAPAATILRVAFTSEAGPPSSLEEALMRVYGEKWKDQTFPTLVSPKKPPIKRSFAEDLARGEKSQTRFCLAQCVRRLFAIRNDEVPNNARVSIILSGLYRDLAAAVDLKLIASTVNRWGIHLDEATA